MADSDSMVWRSSHQSSTSALTVPVYQARTEGNEGEGEGDVESCDCEVLTVCTLTVDVDREVHPTMRMQSVPTAAVAVFMCLLPR